MPINVRPLDLKVVPDDGQPLPSVDPPQVTQELDVTDLARKIAAIMPRPLDGVNGQPGQPGRGIEAITMDKGRLVIAYTDGQRQTLEGLGVTVELFNADNQQVDSEFVPLGGKLRLQQFVRGAK